VLNAFAFELAHPKAVAIVGQEAESLLAVVFGRYCPNRAVARKREGGESVIPLLQGEMRGMRDSHLSSITISCQNCCFIRAMR
jgi:hypothetical protein